MIRHGTASSHESNVLPFASPRRPRSGEFPEQLVTASEASLRATEVYVRLLQDRLEHARRATISGSLGRLDAGTIQRVITASDALQQVCEDALSQIDRQIATRARLVAQAAAERVPGGRG